MMTNIFVYGTLKTGQPNHHIMTKGVHGKARFLGKGHTEEKYPMVIAGEYNIPYLLNIEGTGHHVVGEIYSVDDQLLQFLDEFEECPDIYQRSLKRIIVLEWEGNLGAPEEQAAADILECFIYSTTTYKEEWLNLPTYENYDSFGPHGLAYTEGDAC
ncbi:gamma-glutamylaminecyclotransferase isoform X2 [Ambystoma mexicanum]